ncbi:MAG: hypothetical protein C0404_12610 [Verrucomicrobia bacterium]|nr:hypothetical protein [Verrucomicrobiota bacterium]
MDNNLIQLYIEDRESLSVEQLRELIAMLKADPEAVEELRELLLVDDLVSRTLRADRKSIGTQIEKRLQILSKGEESDGEFARNVLRITERKGLRHRFAVSLAMAAGLLIAAGLGWWGIEWRHAGGTTDARGVCVAKVVEGSGFRVQGSGGEWLVLKTGDEVCAGAKIETAEEGKVKFLYVKEDTEVELSGTTAYRLQTAGKGGYLELGRLSAKVAKQDAGKSFAIETPHARAEVKGTQFRLAVSTNATTIDVRDGLVAFAGASGGSADVAAGQLAVAKAGVAPATIQATAGLDALIARAECTMTAGDIHAMHQDVAAAYEKEFQRGDACNLPALMHLGFASGLTINPKTDRQTEDLRFSLQLAALAYSNVAALRGGLRPADLKNLMDCYASARKAAEGRLYDAWDEDIDRMAKTGAAAGADGLIRDSLLFERVYVTLYERGLARAAQAFLNNSGMASRAAPAAGGVCVSYLRDRLHPIIESEAAEELQFEKAIDFGSLSASSTARFRLRKCDTPGASTPWWIVEQPMSGKEDTKAVFERPTFNEAIFVCQGVCSEDAEDGKRTLWSVGITTMEPTGRKAQAHTIRGVPRGRHAWNRLYVNYDGEWSVIFHVWDEGEQPWGFRRMSERELLTQLAREADGGRGLKRDEQMGFYMNDIPFPARVALGRSHTISRFNTRNRAHPGCVILWSNAAVSFRMLGLKVLRE